MDDITTSLNEIKHTLKKIPSHSNFSETQPETNDIEKLIKKNSLLQERIIAADIILKMYPSLEKDKKNIFNNVLCVKEKKIELYVLEKIKINDICYYKDSQGFIIDENVNVVGIYTYIDNIEKFHVLATMQSPQNNIHDGIELLKKLDNYYN